MENELEIRAYKSTDWENVAVLLQEGYQSTISKKTMEEKYLGDDNGIVVAVKNNTVVGSFFWEIKRDYVRPQSVLYLTYLVVKEEYRRQGIAKKLLHKLEELCKENNCNAIEFTSANFRTNAHALYKSLGYTIKATSVFIKEF